MQRLPVIYEDNHLLVVNKPAGLATMGAEGQSTVHRLAVDYLRDKYQKPGRVYLGIVHRLDTVTSGALLLARTSKAASRLAPQFGGSQRKSRTMPEGSARKFYLAAVSGVLAGKPGKVEHQEISSYIYKDDSARRMRVLQQKSGDAKLARLRYWVCGRSANTTIVLVELLTGRKHQIRAQFSSAGHPVAGDRKYGSQAAFPAGIALHSWRLRCVHPVRREPIWFVAEPPKSWALFKDILPCKDGLFRQIEGEASND